MNQSQYIDHEVRVRILETVAQDIKTLLRLILGAVITGIIIPGVIKYYTGH